MTRPRQSDRYSPSAFAIANLTGGILIGLAFAGLALATDTLSLATLVQMSGKPTEGFLIFLLGSVTTFTQLFLATAIGMMIRAPEKPKRGLKTLTPRVAQIPISGGNP